MPRSAAGRDEEFRLRLAAGDDAALGEVYDLFAPVVYGLAVRVTADAEAARDVTQEVFTELWCKPLAFDPQRGSLRTWLAMLAHRRAVDWVRREVRKRRLTEASREYGRPHTVEEEVVDADVARCVRQVVNRLPPPLLDVVEWTYYRGNTCRQTAAGLGIPEGTVKSRLRRALACIGDELERKGLVS
jgi:RNA polymerase sigma factor (sigma-70 family)